MYGGAVRRPNPRTKQDRLAGRVSFTADPCFCSVDGFYFLLDATYTFPDFHDIGQLTLVLSLLRNKDSKQLRKRGAF